MPGIVALQRGEDTPRVESGTARCRINKDLQSPLWKHTPLTAWPTGGLHRRQGWNELGWAPLRR